MIEGGWLVFAIVASIVLCTGLVLAVAIMRAAWAQREREALTASDLRALEESAVLLIEQLRAEADRSISEIDAKCATLRALMDEADKRIEQRVASCELQAIGNSRPDKTRIVELAAGGLDSAGIARATGIDRAEVNLVLSLSAL